jgi:CRP-like cAMP-binding protein
MSAHDADVTQSSPDNLLLARLAPPDRRRLLACGERVQLLAGSVLAEAGQPLAHALFPIDSSISVLVPMAHLPQLEVGLIGREGMFGLPLVFGSGTSTLRGVVQGAGSAWKVDATEFSRQLAASAALRAALNCYVHVCFAQLAQAVACKSFHRVEQRLARWLLMSADRANRAELLLTHEFLAQMLGVRRAGVTLAARALQERRLIRYARGHVALLDVRALEAAACSCYASEKKTYARLMS